MKANEFNVRPGIKDAFSVYWHYDINSAKEIFSGTEEYCDTIFGMINEILPRVQDKVFSSFKKEKIEILENTEDEMLQILIGGLLFEFISRDFHDFCGREVNCECYLLGKDTGYGYTGGFNILEGKIEKKGIPYDDEYCMNWYIDEMNHDFEAIRQKVINEIQEFIVTNEEHLKLALATDLTWESIKEV